MKGYAEFIEEQTETSIRRKLKLAMAKSKRLGRKPKVGYHDKKTNKVLSGEFQGLM